MALLYFHACHGKERFSNKNIYRVDDHLHEKQVMLDYSRRIYNFLSCITEKVDLFRAKNSEIFSILVK